MNSKENYAGEMMRRGTYYCMILMGMATPLSGQQFSSEGEPCHQKIYKARELYNSGDLQQVLALLEPCVDDAELFPEQRRLLYRLLAEGHLYMQRYEEAGEYARKLAEIDPQLRVFGSKRTQNKEDRDLRTVIDDAREHDAPDLLLLVGNIRYNAFSIELTGGAGTQVYQVLEKRLAPGVLDEEEMSWSGVRSANIAIGARYDPYRFPLSVSVRFSHRGIKFDYQERRLLENGQSAMFNGAERQTWISPELWLSYRFAPRTFPVKALDFALNLGVAADILTASTLENGFLEHSGDQDWFGGQEFNIGHLISQKVYPAILASIAVDYRLNRQSIFAEIQYRRSFLEKYDYSIPQAFHASDALAGHGVSLQIGGRYVFYRAFYK